MEKEKLRQITSLAGDHETNKHFTEGFHTKTSGSKDCSVPCTATNSHLALLLGLNSPHLQAHRSYFIPLAYIGVTQGIYLKCEFLGIPKELLIPQVQDQGPGICIKQKTLRQMVWEQSLEKCFPNPSQS